MSILNVHPEHFLNVAFLHRNLISVSLLNLKRVLNLKNRNLRSPVNTEETAALVDYLSTVKQITACDNKLDLTVFRKLGLLEHLELQNNRLHCVPELSSDDFICLVLLDLSANNVKQTNNFDNLSRLRSLRYLNLNFNGIEEFIFHNSNGFAALETLHLRGNRLKQFGSCFSISQLRELNLAENLLDDLSVQHITDRPFLAVSLFGIYLSKNRLQKRDSIKILSNIPSLYLLDVTNNMLSENVFSALESHQNPHCKILLAAKDLGDIDMISIRQKSDKPKDDNVVEHANKIICSVVDTAYKDCDHQSLQKFPVENYTIPEQEIQALTSGWEGLPQPKSLRQCYRLLKDLVDQPKITVNAFLPKTIPTKFPRRDTRKVTLFWNTVDRHRSSMQKNAIRIDRPGDKENIVTGKRNDKVKERSLNKAVNNIKKLDNMMFDELLSYRRQVVKNREKLGNS